MNRKNQIKILEYITTSQDVFTLEELHDLMKLNGVMISKPDLRSLCESANIKRQPNESGKMVYRKIPHGAKNLKEFVQTTTLTDLILKSDVSGNIVALHTPPACASTVAVILDDIKDPDILATVAGYDTVLVLAIDTDAAKRVAEKTKALIY